MWRRGRDSNPGQSFWPCNRLAGGCLRPTRPPLQASSFRSIPLRRLASPCGYGSRCQWSRAGELVPPEHETDLVRERARRGEKFRAAHGVALTSREHGEPEVARDEQGPHAEPLRLLERLPQIFVRRLESARAELDARGAEHLQRSRVIALLLVLHGEIERALRRI